MRIEKVLQYVREKFFSSSTKKAQNAISAQCGLDRQVELPLIENYFLQNHFQFIIFLYPFRKLPLSNKKKSQGSRLR